MNPKAIKNHKDAQAAKAKAARAGAADHTIVVKPWESVNVMLMMLTFRSWDFVRKVCFYWSNLSDTVN